MRRTSRVAGGLILLAVAIATPVAGDIFPVPASVTLKPGATSVPIALDLTWAVPADVPGVGIVELRLPSALVGSVATLPTPITYPFAVGSTDGEAIFQLVTSAATPAGTWALRLVDLTNQAGRTAITLIVPGSPAPPPPPPPPPPMPPAAQFEIALMPNALDLVAGGPAATVALRTLPDSGFAVPVRFEILGLPPFLAVSPPAAAPPPAYPPVALSVRAAVGATPGTYPARVVATAGGLRRELGLVVRVGMAPAPGFVPEVLPATLALRIGGAGALATVRTMADPGFSEPITYSLSGFPPFVTTGGGRVAAPPGYAPVTFPLGLLTGAVPGTYSGALRAVAGGQLQELPLVLTVLPAAPVVHRVVPGQVTTGGRFVLRLFGEHFASGAQVVSSREQARVEAVRVLTPTLIEVSLLVERGMATGRTELTVIQPTGESSAPPATLLVYAADSPAAPFGVTTVAILYPRPGAQMGAAEEVHPEGLVNATGSGMLVGSWRLDGVPFARFAVPVVAGRAVAVSSPTPIPQSHRGTHRLELVVEHPRELSSGEVIVVQVTDNAAGLQLLAPQPDAVLGPEAPLLRWSPVPGASGYELEIARGEAHAPLGARVSATQWQPSAAFWAMVGKGDRAWRVRPVFPGEVLGAATGWSALVVTDAAPPLDGRVEGQIGRGSAVRPASRDPAAGLRPVLAVAGGDEPPLDGSEPGEPTGDTTAPGEGNVVGSWQTRTELPVTTFGGSEPVDTRTATLALSGQTDVATDRWTVSSAGDLSFVGELEGGASPRQESESWLAGVERRGGGVVGLRAGYAPPDFLDQLELVSGGLAQGGSAIALGKGLWRARFHHAFDPQLGGIAGADFGPEQQLDAAALTFADPEGRYDLRLVGLDVREAASDFAAGGDGESLGLFARLTLGPAHSLVVEGAHGSFAAAEAMAPETTTPEATDGIAFRLGFQGLRGSLQYGVDLRHVEAGFVDPAGGGGTFGSSPDRDSLDLSLSRSSAVSNLGLQVQHVRGGDAFAPNSRVSAANLSYFRSLAASSVTATAGYDVTAADADPELLIPEVRRSGWTLGLALGQTAGALQLTESLTYQDQRDAVDSDNDVTTAMASLGASGAVSERIRLAGGLDGTRIEAGPFQGRTDTWTLSFQPAIDLPAAWLAIGPYLAYTATDNPLLGFDTATEMAQLRLSWSPPWRGSIFGLEVGSDWNRTRDPLLPDGGFAARYSVALTVSWGAEGEHLRRAAPEQIVPPSPLVMAAALRQPWGAPPPSWGQSTAPPAGWR